MADRGALLRSRRRGGSLLARRPAASVRTAARAQRWRSHFGLLAILAALDSPLDPLADELFAAHMTQHVLLLAVAPPLIVLSAPWMRLWQPLPLSFRRTVARALALSPRARPSAGSRMQSRARSPLGALQRDACHLARPGSVRPDAPQRVGAQPEHALFFGTGLLFWGVVIDSTPFRASLGWLAASFTSPRRCSSAGCSRSCSPSHLTALSGYAALAHRPGGLSAMGDQQFAAGVMWVPDRLRLPSR